MGRRSVVGHGKMTKLASKSFLKVIPDAVPTSVGNLYVEGTTTSEEGEDDESGRRRQEQSMTKKSKVKKRRRNDESTELGKEGEVKLSDGQGRLLVRRGKDGNPQN